MTEAELRVRLERLIEETLAEMMRRERVEPGLLSLVADATATLRALEKKERPTASPTSAD
jgi:hypothetical protein